MNLVWTDGSGVARGEGDTLQPIGYAFVVRIGETVLEVGVHDPKGTNNTAELKAAIAALSCLNVGTPITVHSDSEYVINQAKGLWKINTNHDLVMQLRSLSDQHKANWVHVRGHSGDWGNERADQIAGWCRGLRPDMSKPTRGLRPDGVWVAHVRHYSVLHPNDPYLDRFQGIEETKVCAGAERFTLKTLI